MSDPSLKTKPLDDLKYIRLSPGDPESYISFGFTLRERYEVNTAPGFGIGADARDSYLLQRAQIHIDTHFNESWQLFTQFEDVRTFGKADIGGADGNELDLRLAFLTYSQTLDAGTFKARVGRQDFAFDLQRFVSSSDGPNVRQSFDAVWADWESGPWRLLEFISKPVQYRDNQPFDDTSNGHFTFSTIRPSGKSSARMNYPPTTRFMTGRMRITLTLREMKSDMCSPPVLPETPIISTGTSRAWHSSAPSGQATSRLGRRAHG